jgi:hypothetical protein
LPPITISAAALRVIPAPRLMKMFWSSVLTGKMKRFLRGGVRTRRTGFFGYHSFISPVRRSNVLSVVGQIIHPS